MTKISKKLIFFHFDPSGIKMLSRFWIWNLFFTVLLTFLKKVVFWKTVGYFIWKVIKFFACFTLCCISFNASSVISFFHNCGFFLCRELRNHYEKGTHKREALLRISFYVESVSGLSWAVVWLIIISFQILYYR